jgi:hypothetical protein
LALYPGSLEHGQSLKGPAAMASPLKGMERGTIFGSKAILESRDCEFMDSVPRAPLPLEGHPQPYDLSRDTIVGADQVGGVLTVFQHGLGIISDNPAAARDNNVEPPVMGNESCFRQGIDHKIPRRLVEHHGVASADALDQGVAKTWLEFKLG